MTAVALLKYNDALNTGLGGQAFVSAAGQNLVITNNDDTNVKSWRVSLLYAPPGTAVERKAFQEPIALILQNPNSTSVSATLTSLESIPGCYRIMLEVWDQKDFAGVRDVDIRCVGVKTTYFSFILPPYQKDPDPLPLEGAGAKPDELNFPPTGGGVGQSYGWSGDYDAGHRLINSALLSLDSTVGTIERLDWQDSVLSKDENDPTSVPGPSTGDRYIVASGGTGDWSGKDNQIAEWDGGAWVFTLPDIGMGTYVEDIKKHYVYNGTNWVLFGSGAGLVPPTSPGEDNQVCFANSGNQAYADNIKVVSVSNPENGLTLEYLEFANATFGPIITQTAAPTDSSTSDWLFTAALGGALSAAPGTDGGGFTFRTGAGLGTGTPGHFEVEVGGTSVLKLEKATLDSLTTPGIQDGDQLTWDIATGEAVWVRHPWQDITTPSYAEEGYGIAYVNAGKTDLDYAELVRINNASNGTPESAIEFWLAGPVATTGDLRAGTIFTIYNYNGANNVRAFQSTSNSYHLGNPTYTGTAQYFVVATTGIHQFFAGAALLAQLDDQGTSPRLMFGKTGGTIIVEQQDDDVPTKKLKIWGQAAGWTGGPGIFGGDVEIHSGVDAGPGADVGELGLFAGATEIVALGQFSADQMPATGLDVLTYDSGSGQAYWAALPGGASLTPPSGENSQIAYADHSTGNDLAYAAGVKMNATDTGIEFGSHSIADVSSNLKYVAAAGQDHIWDIGTTQMMRLDWTDSTNQGLFVYRYEDVNDYLKVRVAVDGAYFYFSDDGGSTESKALQFGDTYVVVGSNDVDTATLTSAVTSQMSVNGNPIVQAIATVVTLFQDLQFNFAAVDPEVRQSNFDVNTSKTGDLYMSAGSVFRTSGGPWTAADLYLRAGKEATATGVNVVPGNIYLQVADDDDVTAYQTVLHLGQLASASMDGVSDGYVLTYDTGEAKWAASPGSGFTTGTANQLAYWDGTSLNYTSGINVLNPGAGAENGFSLVRIEASGNDLVLAAGTANDTDAVIFQGEGGAELARFDNTGTSPKLLFNSGTATIATTTASGLLNFDLGGSHPRIKFEEAVGQGFRIYDPADVNFYWTMDTDRLRFRTDDGVDIGYEISHSSGPGLDLTFWGQDAFLASGSKGGDIIASTGANDGSFEAGAFIVKPGGGAVAFRAGRDAAGLYYTAIGTVAPVGLPPKGDLRFGSVFSVYAYGNSAGTGTRIMSFDAVTGDVLHIGYDVSDGWPITTYVDVHSTQGVRVWQNSTTEYARLLNYSLQFNADGAGVGTPAGVVSPAVGFNSSQHTTGDGATTVIAGQQGKDLFDGGPVNIYGGAKGTGGTDDGGVNLYAGAVLAATFGPITASDLTGVSDNDLFVWDVSDSQMRYKSLADIGGTSGTGTDHRIARWDVASGALQDSGVEIDDSGNLNMQGSNEIRWGTLHALNYNSVGTTFELGLAGASGVNMRIEGESIIQLVTGNPTPAVRATVRDTEFDINVDLDMNNNNIIMGTGLVDGVDVSNHGSNHISGGADTIPNVTTAVTGLVPLAGTDDRVLRRSGASVGWGQINNAMIINGANIAIGKIAAGSANEVLVTNTLATGVVWLAAGSNNQYLGFNGSGVLGYYQVAHSQLNIDGGHPDVTTSVAGFAPAGSSDGEVLMRTGASVVWGDITNANISTTADIAVSKLADGAANEVLVTNGTGSTVLWLAAGSNGEFLGFSGGVLGWYTPAGGVSGSGANNQITRWDGTSDVQGSAVTIADTSGNMSFPAGAQIDIGGDRVLIHSAGTVSLGQDGGGGDSVTTVSLEANTDIDFSVGTTAASRMNLTTTALDVEVRIDMNDGNAIRFYEPSGTSYAAIVAPSLGANWTLTLPTNNGSPDQVLETDGSGNTSWVDQTAGSGLGAGILQLFPPELGEGLQQINNTELRGGLIIPAADVTITTVHISVQQSDGGDTAEIGIYDASGNQVGGDASPTISSTGFKSATLSSPASLTAGTVYYVMMTMSSATSNARFICRTTNVSYNFPPYGTTSGTCTAGEAPSSTTISSTNQVVPWIALSTG